MEELSTIAPTVASKGFWDWEWRDVWPVVLGAGIVTTLAAALYLWPRKSSDTNRRRAAAAAAAARAAAAKRNEPLLTYIDNRTGPKNQGLEWSERNMKQDSDGDWAHEFLGPF